MRAEALYYFFDESTSLASIGGAPGDVAELQDVIVGRVAVSFDLYQ